MSCARRQSDLFLHAHGQLSGLRRRLLEGHLEGCDCCRAEWARWTVEKDALRRGLGPQPRELEGQGILNAVSARIRYERQAEPEGPLPRLLPPSVSSARSGWAGRTRLAMLPATAVVLMMLGSAATALPPATWLRARERPRGTVPTQPTQVAVNTVETGCGRCHDAQPAECGGLPMRGSFSARTR